MNFNRDYLAQFGQAQAAGGAGALPAINYSADNPDETLASIIERDEARYQQDYIPVENEAIATLDDMSIIEDAGKRVADKSGIDRAMGRAGRESKRYGFNITNAQSQDASANLNINRSASDANTMNNARLNQFDRNRGFRNELINIGRGVSEQGREGLTSAAQMKNARDQRNDAASSSAKAQRWGLAGSAAALAILAL